MLRLGLLFYSFNNQLSLDEVLVYLTSLNWTKE